ncbi:hypothetical protein PspLS_09526 [Pyricularia sp. CBS 133598]|nr:hypothetical protein PspLS_09526 [Pyricularia sp. CBS 133598]
MEDGGPSHLFEIRPSIYNDLSEDSPHDLATSRLGQIRHNVDLLGGRKRPNASSYLQDELVSQIIKLPAFVLDRHKRIDGLTCQVVGDADGCRFSHGRMFKQRSLDFGRREAVAADVDHIINTPSDPVETIVIASGPVTGELFVQIRLGSREV